MRTIDYLRISVTDRCNLRCLYCMPPEGVQPFRHSDILSYEEIVRITEIAVGLGVKKVRLTGGEPLARKNIVYLISELRKIRGIKDMSMTTNGIFLEKYAHALADAGLDRVNVSIDSFDPKKYAEITRGGVLADALRGLDAARNAGLLPVKINMVPIRGLNDNEVRDFANITRNSEYHVRFIECMPSASEFWSDDKYITTDEIKKSVEEIAPLLPVRARKNGPSKYFRFENAPGVIGFISALTHHFCGDCNRLRLTADGKLRPCLFSETEIDVRASLRSGATAAEIERLLKIAVAAKPEGHMMNKDGALRRDLSPSFFSCLENKSQLTGKTVKRQMSKIGG